LNVLLPSAKVSKNCGADAALTSHGSNFAPAETLCPVPAPAPDGPVTAFH
jgi:hypothetical protein